MKINLKIKSEYIFSCELIIFNLENMSDNNIDEISDQLFNLALQNSVLREKQENIYLVQIKIIS